MTQKLAHEASFKPLTSRADVQKTRVLVVDDSALQRKIVSLNLRKWGFEIEEAESGEAALKLCREQEFDVIISDWIMPEMDGLEFCKEFRKLDMDRYGYFILVTSKNEKNDVAKGLEIGADDFLSKPVNAAELKARIRAGTRVLEMERKLQKQKQALNTTLKDLQAAQEELNRDLAEAEKLQHSLVPVRYKKMENGEISLLLRSSGHVGGDLVGFFSFSKDRIGLFSLDVSGHGISSALLTARLAGYLSPHNKTQNIAFEHLRDGSYSHRTPAEIARTLNDRMMNELETEHYFTLAFVDIDLTTGAGTFVQAGHPHPVVFNQSDGVRFLGSGGPPIGLIPDMEYENVSFELRPGDHLLLHSDGVTECHNSKGELFDEDGLENMLAAQSDTNGPEFLNDLIWALTDFADGIPFDDDVSAILLKFDAASPV